MSAHRIELESRPDDPRLRATAERGLALDLGVALAEARVLLTALPARYPRSIASPEEARRVVERLAELGIGATSAASASPVVPCATHSQLWGHLACTRCSAPLCAICLTHDGAGTCRACSGRTSRSRRFFHIRVAVLLAILAGVLLYAWGDIRQRELRTDWTRTLRVAVVLVPLERLDESAVSTLSTRTAALEERLAIEMQRYRQGPRPFSVELVAASRRAHEPPPVPPTEPDDWWGTLQFNWQLRRWTSRVDDEAALDADVFDARIYLAANDGQGNRTLNVEGVGQQGGRVGVVQIDLAASMVDVTLFVAAHELFHILGASDKYTADGHVSVPDGLADPDREPRYPQDGAELMARHRALSADKAVMPESLDELRIGRATAREVRWLNGP